MKKNIIIVVGILIGIILIILLDTLQARILKRSPIISWKEELADDDSWVDRGIFMDTYYCTKAQDTITVNWELKGKNFTCSIDNIQIKKFVNYDFSVTVNSNTKYKKIYVFNYNKVDYYYGNTDFELSLIENKHKHNIEISLKNKLVTIDDILTKAKIIEPDKNSKSKLYKYDNFNIIVCNTESNNNEIIIGDSNMQIENNCQ